MSQNNLARLPTPLTAADAEVEVSLVVPVYNEVENLRPLYTEIAEVMSQLEPAKSWELVLVNDGSTDESPKVLAELKAADPHVRVLNLVKNAGQSAAFAAGFKNVRGRAVVTLDGDMQNDPRDIPQLLKGLETHDIVCGIRAKRRDDFIRRVSSKIGNGCRRAFTGDNIVDTGCSLKAFKREVVAKLPMFNGMHRFLATLGEYAGGKVHQIPVNHRERTRGVSKYGVWNRMWVTIGDLMAVYWMRRRWLHYTVEEVQ